MEGRFVALGDDQFCLFSSVMADFFSGTWLSWLLDALERKCLFWFFVRLEVVYSTRLVVAVLIEMLVGNPS